MSSRGVSWQLDPQMDRGSRVRRRLKRSLNRLERRVRKHDFESSTARHYKWWSS